MLIRTKMVLVVSIVLLCVTLTISGIWYTDSTQLMDKYIKTTGGEMMKSAYNNFSYILTDTEYMSTMISLNADNIIEPLNAFDEDSRSDPWQLTGNQLQSKKLIDRYIDSMYGYKYYVTGIKILSVNGFESQIGSGMRDKKALPVALRDVSFSDKTVVILSPEVSDNDREKKVVPLVHSIKSNRQIIGYVVIFLDYDMIKDIFSTNLPKNSRYEIRDGSGTTIFTNCEPGDTLFSEHKRGYVYNASNAETVGWQLSMAIPSKAILSEMSETVYRVLSVFGIIYAVAIMISVIFIYGLTNRLKILSKAMNRVSGGDLSVKTAIGGRDEIATMSCVFNEMVGNIKVLMERIVTEEKKKRATEIDFLQAQINPHFISNTLNTISWMAQVNNSNNIRELTNSLITLLQSSMRRGAEFITIQDEVNYIKSYVAIMNCCGSYEFDMEYRIDQSVGALKTLRFILQPIVENAIIHGIADLIDREGRISISVCRREDRVCIEVRDNGTGMTPRQMEDTLSGNNRTNKSAYSKIGVKNVNDRIRLFFGEGYGISFQSEIGRYTAVRILLPVME